MILQLSSGGDSEEAKRLLVLVERFDRRRAADWLMREIHWAEEQWQIAVRKDSTSKIHAREGLATRIYVLQIFMVGLDSKGLALHCPTEGTEGD